MTGRWPRLVATMLVLVGLVSTSGGTAAAPASKEVRALASAFAAPDPGLGVLAEWMWDECVDDDGIDRQLQAMVAQGVTEVVIERWDGLVTGTQPEQTGCSAYLSEAFFAEIGHALATARRLGMHVWIYDGNAAGDDTGAQQAALAGHPELQGQVMNERLQGVRYETSTSGMDKLNPASAQRLIEVEYAQYARRFPDFLGSTLKGFWKDEPQLAGGPSQNGRPTGSTLPWSPTLPAYFLERFGYAVDEPAVLASVLHGSTAQDRKRRYDFWRAISDRYADAHFGVLQRWAHEQGLQLLVQPRFDDAELRSETSNQGSYFAVQRHADIPGADLWSGSRADDNFKNATEGMNLYQVASAGHLYGKTRVQQEPYGVTQGTGLEVAQQKALADRMYARGINMISPAVTHYGFNSSQSVFAGDYGPMNPAWVVQDLLGEHLARLGTVLTAGTHVADVGVVHPLTSAWLMDPDTGGDTAALQRSYLNAGGALQVSWRGLEVLPEEVFEEPATRVTGGAINRPGVSLGTVVLPGLTALAPATLTALEDLVAGGGSVVATTRLPDQSTDGRDADLVARVQRLFGLAGATPVVAGDLHDRRSARGGHAVYVPRDYATANATSLADLRPLLAALDLTSPQDAVLSAPTTVNGLPGAEVYHVRSSSLDAYLVANYPANNLQGVPAVFGPPAPQRLGGTLSLPVRGAPQLWDPDTGTSRPAPVWWTDGDRTVLRLDVPGYGVALVVVPRSGPAPAHVLSTDVPVLDVQELPDATRVVLDPATAGMVHLTLRRDGVDQQVVAAVSPPSAVAVPGPFAVTYAPWPGLPVASTSPSPDTQGYGDLAPTHPGFSGTATYTTRISTPGGRQRIDLGTVLNYVEVRVDGQLIGRRGWPPYALVADLSAGEHELTIAVTNTMANTTPGIDVNPVKAFGLLGPIRITPAEPTVVTVPLKS